MPLFVLAGAALGRGTRRAPLSQSRNASQWIAATIFKVTSGSSTNDRNNAAVVRSRRRPLKVAASRGPSPSVCRIRNLTLSSGGETRKWYRIVIAMKGET